MSEPAGFEGIRVATVGHSTRSFEELVALLRHHEVEVLIDIRTMPRSRRNPQFNGDALGAALAECGLEYAHIRKLGGLRRARPDSPNTAWRNASFRGYADYMQTAEFEAGLSELHALAEQKRAALMCAEAVPWRCHRLLVADVITARGGRVEHITSESRTSAHRMTPFARVRGNHVVYPDLTSVAP